MSDFPIEPAPALMAEAPPEPVPAFAPVVPDPLPAAAPPPVTTAPPACPDDGSLAEIVSWLKEHAQWAERHVLKLVERL